MTDVATRAAKVERWKLEAILFVLGVAGILFNTLSHFVWPWLESIFKELGSALIVSAVLGATVDIFFKGELARNAFFATFRYLLPAEFKDEVEKILRFDFLAEKQVWTVKVEKISDDIVQVTTGFERIVRNKTKYGKPIEAWYQLEDYGFDNGPTKIIECVVQDEIRIQKSSSQKVKEHYVEVKTSSIMVRPGHTAKVSGKAIQYRRINDIMYETFRVPIVNPEIVVLIDDNQFSHKVEFGTHGDYVKAKYDNRYVLSGVYFPGQFMNVRWWPKKSAPESEGNSCVD